MQVIFGVMIFEEEPRRTTVQSITGILTVGEDEVNEVIDALVTTILFLYSMMEKLFMNVQN